MGNNLEKSGQFLHHAENGKWSGKIWTVETLSGKWEMIWKNPDSCDTVRKMGNDLDKSGQFWHCPKKWKWSGKFRTVVKLSGKWELIWKNPDCLSGFSLICPKISVRTKNFHAAMLSCTYIQQINYNMVSMSNFSHATS